MKMKKALIALMVTLLIGGTVVLSSPPEKDPPITPNSVPTEQM